MLLIKVPLVEFRSSIISWGSPKPEECWSILACILLMVGSDKVASHVSFFPKMNGKCLSSISGLESAPV